MSTRVGDSTASPDEVPGTEGTEEPGLAGLVHRLGGLVAGALSAGDVAALRRLDPSAPSSPAFWKLVVGELEPASALHPAASNREEQERRWAVILNALAHLGDLNTPGRDYGKALAASGFSEHRFSRLLRARSDTLWFHARRSAQFLAAQGESVDATGLAWLILSEDRSDEQRARRRLARSYYRAQSKTEGA